MGNLWSSSTSSRLLQPSSQISALFYCDNCGKMIDDVSWKQCDTCKEFDLCRKCGELPVDELKGATLEKHKLSHPQDDPISSEDMPLVLVGDAEKLLDRNINNINDDRFKKVISLGKIQNDWEMAIVMDALQREKKSSTPSFLLSLTPEERSKLNSMIVEYHIPSYDNTVHVLSLDGGGVRGYMSIRVLEQLIIDNHLPDIDPNINSDNEEYKRTFLNYQEEFTDQFDHFAGTSTGGLIAFCLATKYPLLEIKKIYGESPRYFTKTLLNKMPSRLGILGNAITAKYDNRAIHGEIDKIIQNRFATFNSGRGTLTAENATLGDLNMLLNPDKDRTLTTTESKTRKKVLLINAYDTTTSCITVFNTSFEEHWGYRVADVLKATMAAPTYFQPHHMCEWESKENGSFGKKKHINGIDVEDHIYIDGGVFANDPELTAIWAIRMEWKQLVNYRLLSIGTGCFNPELPRDSWGGYYAWVLKKPSGLVIQTLMDATRSLTETVVNNLAKFNNIKRIKFNYKLKQSMELDDPNFPSKFEEEWDKSNNVSEDQLIDALSDGSRGLSKDKLKYGLRYGPDYKALLHFYQRHIHNQK